MVRTSIATAGPCAACWGWGLLSGQRFCPGCASWKRNHPTTGRCQRCRHHTHISNEELCRPCLQAIRLEDDIDFVTHRDPARPRARQLILLLHGVPAPRTVPLRRDPGSNRVRVDQPWHTSSAATAIWDDPSVLPPAVPGQQRLFAIRRRLPPDAAQRIQHRPVRGFEQAAQECAAFAAEYGLGKQWQSRTGMWLRVALALRDADGHDVLPQESLGDLPYVGEAISQILQRARLLSPRAMDAPPARWTSVKGSYADTKRAPAPRTCADCGAWMCYGRNRCRACQGWRGQGHSIGTCARCGRDGLPLLDGYCRNCCLHLTVFGVEAVDEPFTQLWLGDPIPAGIRVRRSALRSSGRTHSGERSLPAPSPHLAVPGEQVLMFHLQRDWSSLAGRRPDELPALTEPARRLVEDFEQVMREQHWERTRRFANRRTLTVIVSWLGAEVPIAEADVYDLVKLDPYLSAKRVCQFLQSRGLLLPDPTRRRDRNREWIEQVISQLPHHFPRELRGVGERPSWRRSVGTSRSQLRQAFAAVT